jgi:CrcB protein
MAILVIAIGGAIGSVLRYVLGGFFQRSSASGFPVGTLLVNVTGSFLIGALAQHFMNTQTHPLTRAALITGLCGGYTTFSAFSLETVALIEGGEIGKAAAYLVLSVMLSVAAAFAGMAAVRATT